MDHYKKSLTTPHGRLYFFGDSEFPIPSVTTILDKTQEQEKKDALSAWRKRVGIEKAEEIRKNSTGLGTKVHSILEDYFTKKALPPSTTIEIKDPLANTMANKIIESLAPRIESVIGNEIKIYYPELYAGTIDMVAKVITKENNSGCDCSQLMVVDFKTATNINRNQKVYDDYKLQSVAYALAYNFHYKTNISNTLIILCDKNLNICEINVNSEEFQIYEQKWWKRTMKFWDIYFEELSRYASEQSSNL